MHTIQQQETAFGRNKEELETVSVPEGNILQGTLTEMTVDAYSVLTLGRENQLGTGYVGFWTYSGTNIPAHRVYIDAALLGDENEANGFTLNFDGNTDTVEKVAVENINADNAWYNLQGMQLKNAPVSQGIYIHNGKKVVVK